MHGFCRGRSKSTCQSFTIPDRRDVMHSHYPAEGRGRGKSVTLKIPLVQEEARSPSVVSEVNPNE
jgi:hypothetical protein